MATISVIVPVYKVEKYLRRCLDSVLAQTYTDFEVICVNDGSPDRCGEILAEYMKKDSRIIVLTQENKGLSGARNTGLDWMYAHRQRQRMGIVYRFGRLGASGLSESVVRGKHTKRHDDQQNAVSGSLVGSGCKAANRCYDRMRGIPRKSVLHKEE